MNIAKIFLLLLSLACITSLQAGIKEDQKNYKEIKIGSPVEYDKSNNLFKFTYNGNASIIVLYFQLSDISAYLTDPNGNKNKMEENKHEITGKLMNNGTYLLEIICDTIAGELGGKFETFIPASSEEIDLNKNIYFQNFIYESELYYNYPQFKVKNLNEDKYVYFKLLSNDDSYYTREYYPYYPNEPEPSLPPDGSGIDFSNLTIFEVVNKKEPQKSMRNVNFYKFEKNTEYEINIHCLKNIYKSSNQYRYMDYIFFAVTNSNIKNINRENGFTFITSPTIGVINSNLNQGFYLFFGEIPNEQSILYSKTNEIIQNNLEILAELNYYTSNNMIQIYAGESSNTVLLLIPPITGVPLKMYVFDEIEVSCKDSYFIPANKAKLIYCSQTKEEMRRNESFNLVLTYKSPYNNMRVTLSDEEKATDYIIQNTYPFLVYVEKTDKDCTITLTKYLPKFTFFGAENPYIFNAFFNLAKKQYYYKEGGVNIDNYVHLTQMNFRINSKYIPWIEFYNFYLNQLNLKFNFYIRQLYGGSDLYECNADDFDEKNLISLTNPISNTNCKNKKSLFNRLWPLSGTKILSGYISPDSYFDVYAEINNDTNHVINMSPIMSQNLRFNNNAKYLKKDVTYTLNFNLNHLIKLEPGFNAEIEIKNSQKTFTINPKNPTIELTGEGYTIKSNNDTMIYFFGRLPNGVKGREIELDKSKGKIVKISNYNKNCIIDFGFEYYFPSIFPVPDDFQIRDNKVIYLDNLYEKLKVKLVPNEKLFIYGEERKTKNLIIEYIDKNLNNANNDYNIFLVTPNEENNTIIIDAKEVDEIYPDIYFCQQDTNLNLFFLRKNNEESYIFNNSGVASNILNLFRGDNKLSLKTNKPVIFTYSYHDYKDKKSFDNNTEYKEQRKVLNDLKINEITDKNNNDNMIKIKFKANYRNSSTRYIILIAPKNNENTLDTFKDACHVVGLLNQKPQGVKTEAVYDVGENELIDAEVDITDILNDKNEYIMSIISQELRFEKKIKFYEPKEFNHIGKSPNKDSDNGDGGLSGTSLALAIILPIIGVIIIAVIVIVILRKRKGSSSDDIEKIENLTALT